jgi:hypothetical protein
MRTLRRIRNNGVGVVYRGPNVRSNGVSAVYSCICVERTEAQMSGQMAAVYSCICVERTRGRVAAGIACAPMVTFPVPF